MLAQVDEARQAIARDDHRAAITLLTPAVVENPTADTFLYLGLAHAHISEYDRALEVFREGATLYPDDPRFHSETAGVHLANRDTAAAIQALDRALEVAPLDDYASDLLASLQLSQGHADDALLTWNRVSRPRIDQIFENFSPGFLNWSVPRTLTFGPGEVLRHEAWKTTRDRLFESGLFSNVGLDVEPSGAGELYNAIVRTTNRRNTATRHLVDLVRGLPVETTYMDLWNIGFTGISWRSSFRWDEDRRKLEGRLIVPLPFASLPVLELADTWRSERWDLSPTIQEAFAPDAGFDYGVNALSARLTVTPVHQFQMSLGFTYRNRQASGRIALLGMNSANSATVELGALLRPRDGRYKNQIRIRGFLARESLIGDFDFTGGSIEIRNRLLLTDTARTHLDWALTGGSSRGNVPVDQYFVLGLGNASAHRLRGHVASQEGRYGRAPMGTDFVLWNADIQHRLLTVPLFNTFDIPFIEVKAMGFFDSGKVFDRQRIFRQGHWLNDVGGGIRFETPTSSFTVLYGRDTNGGESNFYGYVERQIW